MDRTLNSKELAKFLYDHEVYDSYQFIINTRKTIKTALFCKESILSLISKMTEEQRKWQSDFYNELLEQSGPIKKVALTYDRMPTYSFNVADIETNIPFLLDKLTKDFFQYVRNAFDCMSQAANAACLSTRAKNIERVDFGFMKKVFEQQSYSQDFPSISRWFTNIANCDELKYIEDFNNRTKHICDVYIKLSMSLIGKGEESTINPFYKKEQQHEKQDISEYLTEIYDFVSKAYHDFITALRIEIAKKLYIANRYHKVKVYQQKIKDNPDNGFSMVYIDATCDIVNMPDEIEVLLIHEDDDEISAKNCPVGTIYIKDPNKDNSYIGKYVVQDNCGDDTLIKYRKYQKIIPEPNKLPLVFQAMTSNESKNVFYHANQFMDITTISDDPDFRKRVQLPF